MADKKTTDEVASIVGRYIEASQSFLGGEIQEERSLAQDYYNGVISAIPAAANRSSVVSRDLSDVVDRLLPDFMEIFASTDNYGAFAPQGPEDEEGAKQATDAVNYVIMRDNDGYTILHDWIKTALIEKNGYVKCWVEEEGEPIVERLHGLDAAAIAMLMQDSEVVKIKTDLVKAPEGDDPSRYPSDPNDPAATYDCEIERRERNRIRIMGVPPEEMLVERQLRRLDEANFVGHYRADLTRSDLVSMGYDKETVERLPHNHGTAGRNDALQRRQRRTSDQMRQDAYETALETIDVYECYVRIDMDGDGIAELVKVVVAGDGHTVLPDPETGDDTVEVDEHPFLSITPYMVPYSHIGQSVHDKMRDIQDVKTVIQRQTLDNMYSINNNRLAINRRVNRESVLDNRVGGIVEIEDREPVAGCISELPVQPLVSVTVPMLEYWDRMLEMRTAPRLDTPLSEKNINDTAFGANLMAGEARKQMLYMARTMAETGIKGLAKRVFRLMLQYQQREMVLRLRNQWVPVDPRTWNAAMDFEIDVGIGSGTFQQRAAHLKSILALQMQAIQMQGGAAGPAVRLQNVIYTAQQLITALGFKNPELFFPSPSEQDEQPQPPPPDPAIEAIKADTQVKMQKVTVDSQEAMAKLQLEYQRQQADVALRTRELQIREFEAETKAKQQMQAAETAAQQQQAAQPARNGVELPNLGEAGRTILDLAGGIARSSEALRGSIARMAAAVDKARQPKVLKLSETDMPIGVE